MRTLRLEIAVADGTTPERALAVGEALATTIRAALRSEFHGEFLCGRPVIFSRDDGTAQRRRQSVGVKKAGIR